MITWEYLAGFLDGDGYITHYATGHTVRYTVGFTQKATREVYMKQIFDFLVDENVSPKWVPRVSQTPSAPTPVAMIDIRVSEQRHIISLLEKLQAHLVFKKTLAIQCLCDLKDRRLKRGDDMLEQYPKAQRTGWSDIDIKTLQEMAQQGYQAKVIAAALRRTPISIWKKAHRLQIRLS